MICQKCGATVPEGWPFCLDCGTPTGGRNPAAGRAVEPELFPLLAAANLSRRRGAFADAEKQCADIIRRYPGSAAPHSLMGEICEDQRQYGDAITHYQMALQIDPANEADRKRLAAARERLAAAQTGAAPAIQGRTAGNRFSYRSSSSPALWLAVGALAIVCLGLVGYLVYTLSSQPASTTPPVPGGVGIPASQRTRMLPSSAVETAPEAAIQSALNGAAHPNVAPFHVDNVMIDPRQPGSTLITASLVAPLAGPDNRSSVIQVAGAVAQAAGTARVDRCAIRVVGAVGGGAPGLLFVGDAAPASFASSNPAAYTVAGDLGRFQNTWWSSDLP